jgi:hypothetical protein
MSANAHTPLRVRTVLRVVGFLVQHFHHRRLLVFVFDQHATRAAHVLDNIDDFAETRCCAARLCEACEAQVGALAVLEDNEEFDDEGDGFDLEVCGWSGLAR